MHIVNVLRGLVLNPLLVAFARGAAEAAVMAIILFASDATFLKDALPDELKGYIPLIVLGLRQVEGLADRLDPAKQRRRDTLREAAAISELTDGDATAIKPGDVLDDQVEGIKASIEEGDHR